MERPLTAATQDAIHVLATTFEATRAALVTAIPLARGSSARLIVIVTQVVPFAISLDHPVDSAEFTIRRYRDLLSGFGADAQIRLCVCRRTDDVLTQLLPRGATVVLSGPASGLVPSPEVKMIRRMTRLGHHVVFVPMVRGDVVLEPYRTQARQSQWVGSDRG